MDLGVKSALYHLLSDLTLWVSAFSSVKWRWTWYLPLKDIKKILWDNVYKCCNSAWHIVRVQQCKALWLRAEWQFNVEEPAHKGDVLQFDVNTNGNNIGWLPILFYLCHLHVWPIEEFPFHKSKACLSHRPVGISNYNTVKFTKIDVIIPSCPRKFWRAWFKISYSVSCCNLILLVNLAIHFGINIRSTPCLTIQDYRVHYHMEKTQLQITQIFNISWQYFNMTQLFIC